MIIELTDEEARILYTVFLPKNPNKMRKADPRVIALARKLKATLYTGNSNYAKEKGVRG